MRMFINGIYFYLLEMASNYKIGISIYSKVLWTKTATAKLLFSGILNIAYGYSKTTSRFS